MYFALLQNRLVAHLKERVRSGEWTERGLARFIGISQPHMHHVLSGARLLSVRLSDSILHKLKLTVSDLFELSELRRLPEAASGLAIQVPAFTSPIGPGFPFPRDEYGPQKYGVPRDEMEGVEDPAIAHLAEDRQMVRLFQAGDLALLDRSQNKRQGALADGMYAISLRDHSLLRYVRHSGIGLHLWIAEEHDSVEPTYISLAGRNILDVVRAKVVWLVRRLG